MSAEAHWRSEDAGMAKERHWTPDERKEEKQKDKEKKRKGKKEQKCNLKTVPDTPFLLLSVLSCNLLSAACMGSNSELP